MLRIKRTDLIIGFRYLVTNDSLRTHPLPGGGTDLMTLALMTLTFSQGESLQLPVSNYLQTA